MPPVACAPGHVLDSTPHGAPAQSIPLSREQGISNRIEALLARGCEAKIDGLIDQMREAAFLSVETQKELENWNTEFFNMDPSDREARSLALGLLLFRVIRPSLLQGASLEQRDQLLIWEGTCQEILQQTLPEGESVITFLEECEVGIREERLMRDLCHRADAAAQAQMEALCAITQRMNNQLEQAYGSCKQHLNALQNKRKEMHQQIDSKVKQLQVKIEHLNIQMAMHATKIATLSANGLSNSGLESDLVATKMDLKKIL
jgi:uncharacterized protein YceH (UPF0502 family)